MKSYFKFFNRFNFWNRLISIFCQPLNFQETAQSLVTTQLTAPRKMSSHANNSSLEFSSSENKFKTAHSLIKRCLFIIFSVVCYLAIFQIILCLIINTILLVILLMIIIALGILTIILSCIFASALHRKCEQILIKKTKEFHKQLKKDQKEYERKQEEEALANAFGLQERSNNWQICQNKKKHQILTFIFAKFLCHVDTVS